MYQQNNGTFSVRVKDSQLDYSMRKLFGSRVHVISLDFWNFAMFQLSNDNF